MRLVCKLQQYSLILCCYWSLVSVVLFPAQAVRRSLQQAAFYPAAASTNTVTGDRSSLCNQVNGYTVQVDVDHEGDDILTLEMLNPSTALATLAAACSAIPACRGFRAHGAGAVIPIWRDAGSVGFLKYAVQPATPAPLERVSCLYQRLLTGSVRLVGGGWPGEGRLEAFMEGAGWGGACSNGFGAEEAAAVCRQLGSAGADASAARAVPGIAFGAGAAAIWLANVSCPAGAPGLAACTHAPWGRQDCPGGQDVGVACSAQRPAPPRPPAPPPPATMQLTGGATAGEGLLQLYYKGQWGTVCAAGFGTNEAVTVCQQLGFDGAGPESVQLASLPHWSQDSVVMPATAIGVVGAVSCPFGAPSLEQCVLSPWTATTCAGSTGQDVYVRCSASALATQLPPSPPLPPLPTPLRQPPPPPLGSASKEASGSGDVVVGHEDGGSGSSSGMGEPQKVAVAFGVAGGVLLLACIGFVWHRLRALRGTIPPASRQAGVEVAAADGGAIAGDGPGNNAPATAPPLPCPPQRGDSGDAPDHAQPSPAQLMEAGNAYVAAIVEVRHREEPGSQQPVCEPEAVPASAPHLPPC